MSTPLLEIHDLSIAFHQGGRETLAVDKVSLSLARGRTLALVGESGSGKSITALSIVKLLGSTSATYPSGTILFKGKDLLQANEDDLRNVRGNEITMVFQEPMTSLNPLFSVGDQIAEVLELKLQRSRKQAWSEAIAWLERTGLDDAALKAKHFPHQLSGGQRKRTALAQMLALDPDLLLMDEPFSALDIQTRQLMENEVLALWQQKARAVLFITHDLDEAIALSDRVVVMSAGPASRPIGDFKVDLPRPRDVAEVRHTPRFMQLHQAIWDVLRDEVLKGYRQQLPAAVSSLEPRTSA